jgi:hypothetical protein
MIAATRGAATDHNSRVRERTEIMAIAKHARFIIVGVVAALGGAAVAFWMPGRVAPHGFGLWALLVFAVIAALLGDTARTHSQ